MALSHQQNFSQNDSELDSGESNFEDEENQSNHLLNGDLQKIEESNYEDSSRAGTPDVNFRNMQNLNEIYLENINEDESGENVQTG